MKKNSLSVLIRFLSTWHKPRYTWKKLNSIKAFTPSNWSVDMAVGPQFPYLLVDGGGSTKQYYSWSWVI